MPEQQIIASREEARFFPYAGLFHVIRHSFWTAGQDSYSFPPAQNPDMFAQLTNVEPVVEGNILRRRGYSLFNNTQAQVYTRAFVFQSLKLGIRRLFFGNTSTFSSFLEDGTFLAAIFTPSPGALAPRATTSRDFTYFADGVQADQIKYDGTVTSNWGIDINATSASGPKLPTTVSQSGTGIVWTNPTNIEATDGLFTTVQVASGGASQNLATEGYGFAIGSSARIVGIKAIVTGTASDINGNLAVNNIQLSLLVAGVAAGTSKIISLPFGNGAVSAGGTSDLWGLNLLPTDINATTFGIQLTAKTPKGKPTVNYSVDSITITIYTQVGSIIIGALTAGAVTLTVGRRYTYCFLNSTSGTTSSIAPFSVSSGPLTSQQVPLSGIPTSADPQVTHVLLLATADGGDETTLFLLAQLLIGTTTYTDNTTEVILEGSAVYQETDLFGVNHGVANNDTPPALQVATTHRGRVFGVGAGSNAAFLFFSKNLNEVLTSTGTITGHWEEEWPATFQLPIGKEFQTGRGLLSDGQVLYIGTERSILRLIGDSPQNFNVPEVVFNETGILSQEVWQMVFLEDQPVGTMWLTPDFRVMLSDFNTYRDVGLPIQDALNSINTAATVPPWSVYVNHGAFDLWMLWIPTSANTTPDTCCVYNLKTAKWFIWKPTDSGTTGVFNINASGVPQWLFATNANPIYQWELDGTTFQDRINNTPVSYPVTIQTSFLNFGDLTLKKVLQQIIVYSGDTALTTAVDGAQTEAQFITPVVVKAATTLTTDPFGNQFVPLAGAVSKWHWYRFTFVSPAGTTKQVLSGYDIEAVPVHRL